MHSLTLQQLGHGMVLVYKRGETDVETYAIISIIVLAEQERRQERDAVKITWLKTKRDTCEVMIESYQPETTFTLSSTEHVVIDAPSGTAGEE